MKVKPRKIVLISKKCWGLNVKIASYVASIGGVEAVYFTNECKFCDFRAVHVLVNTFFYRCYFFDTSKIGPSLL